MKLSDEYTVVWPGIVIPKDKLLTDSQDEFSFEIGDTLVGVNRNTEIFWRNRSGANAYQTK